MNKRLNTTRYSLFLPIFLFAIFLVPSHSVLAANNESKSEQISSIMTQVESIKSLIKDREEFLANKVHNQTVASEQVRSEDFFLKVSKDSSITIYGSEKTPIIFETDGGVRQIVITSSCENLTSKILTFSNSECKPETWIVDSKLSNGVKSFTLPLSYISKKDEDIVKLSVYACRFNGCVFEDDFEILYKKESVFSEVVDVYNRYEWEYEWKNQVYYVQEVLLNFPYKDVKWVYLDVDCDNNKLYIETTEDDRATCNQRRKFTKSDFRSYTKDDQGNVYNLRIESVSNKMIVEETTDAVELEFSFIGYNNQIIDKLYHRPLKK